MRLISDTGVSGLKLINVLLRQRARPTQLPLAPDVAVGTLRIFLKQRVLRSLDGYPALMDVRYETLCTGWLKTATPRD